MKSSFKELPVTKDNPQVIVRKIEWGGMSVGAVEVRQTYNDASKYKGLPDDQCQLPHWGYILEGQFRSKIGDQEEVYKAGDVFYLPPGHTSVWEAGSVYIAFTLADESAKKQAEVLQAKAKIS